MAALNPCDIKAEIMVTKPLTMIKGTLPIEVSFDPPDR
jgi:hypothetical protein